MMAGMPRMTPANAMDDDELALLCATSTLGRTPLELEEPLGPVTWHELARTLDRHGRSPGWLFETSALGLRAIGVATATANLVMRRMTRRDRVIEDREKLRAHGYWMATEIDPAYPSRLMRLGERRPTVVYGVGEQALLEAPSVAVVGSRDVDPAGAAFAERAGRRTAEAGSVLVSGGARGTDVMAMGAAGEAGGRVVGVLSADLPRWAGEATNAAAIAEGQLTLLTIAHPEVPFSNAIALARNKVIYALGDVSLVVACDSLKGGTRHGAMEAIKHGWGPVLVRAGVDAPPGNALLINDGAYAIGDEDLDSVMSLQRRIDDAANAWAERHESGPDDTVQPRLIDD